MLCTHTFQKHIAILIIIYSEVEMISPEAGDAPEETAGVKGEQDPTQVIDVEELNSPNKIPLICDMQVC